MSRAFSAPGRAPRLGLSVCLGGTLIIALTVVLLATSASASARSRTARFAAPVPNTALLLGSTVTAGTATDGSGKSLEQQQAEADGFTVTVVDDPTWSSMTAAQFAAFQVIIIGDPTCGSTVDTTDVAAQNASTWEPVVMSSGGNKVLIGTDPTFHNDGPSGTQRGDLLEKNGIAFAGAVSGATGAYIDLSCTYDSSPAGTPVPILDGLSTHGSGQFTVIGEGPINACGTSVNIVASSGPTSGLHDADLSNWGCSVHEAFDKFPADYTPLVLAPSNSGFPVSYCANDVETGTLACGSPYIMVSGSGVTVTSQITLSPKSQTLTVGGTATLTAHVSTSSGPVSGGNVSFSVDSGPNVGQTFSGSTNSSGDIQFSYDDTGGAGTDNVSATYTDPSGVQQKDTATVTWSSGGGGDPAITASGRTFTTTKAGVCADVAKFTDPDPAATASEYSATIKWGDRHDGPTSPGTIKKSLSGAFEVSGCHFYSKAGTYTVTVVITDVDNTSNTATATTTLTDNRNAAPVKHFRTHRPARVTAANRRRLV